jgi:cytochrome oxidase Cu insertion factor (SCO1/SenC/PrrC family)
MPDFALRDQEGRLVRAEDLRDKVVVLTFLETKCQAACPIIAGEVARAWTLLTPRERAQSAAVAISADPRDDTPANIRTFLSRHRASRTIRYLVGPVPVMRDVWRSFLVLSAVASGDADTHSAPVRIYGRDLTWLATQHVGVDLSPRNLAHDIRVALTRHPS